MNRFLSFVLAAGVSIAAAAWSDVEAVIACPGDDASTRINISWASHIPGTSVEYAPTSQWDGAARNRMQPTYHRLCTTYDSIRSKSPAGEDIREGAMFVKCAAELSGLTPGTSYTYRVINADGTVATQPHHFTTAPASGPWSCCVISDFHVYAPLPARTQAAMQMLATVKRHDPAMSWVLHLGDVAAWGGSWSFWSQLYEQPYFHKYMWAGLNGNHDNMSRGYDKTTGDFFRNANYVPRNGYKGQEGVCYNFRYADALFVMLNNEAMRDSTGFDQAAAWLRQVVTQARRGSNPPRYVIVCEHYQWFYGETGKTSQYARWSPIFDELGIDLALGANNHIYASTEALLGGRKTDGTTGTVYVQTSSSDNERGQDLKEWQYNRDLIKRRWSEGPKTVSALSMKVDSRHITLTLLDRTGTALDTVTVLAKH